MYHVEHETRSVVSFSCATTSSGCFCAYCSLLIAAQDEVCIFWIAIANTLNPFDCCMRRNAKDNGKMHKRKWWNAYTIHTHIYCIELHIWSRWPQAQRQNNIDLNSHFTPSRSVTREFSKFQFLKLLVIAAKLIVLPSQSNRCKIDNLQQRYHAYTNHQTVNTAKVSCNHTNRLLLLKLWFEQFMGFQRAHEPAK